MDKTNRPISTTDLECKRMGSTPWYFVKCELVECSGLFISWDVSDGLCYINEFYCTFQQVICYFFFLQQNLFLVHSSRKAFSCWTICYISSVWQGYTCFRFTLILQIGIVVAPSADLILKLACKPVQVKTIWFSSGFRCSRNFLLQIRKYFKEWQNSLAMLTAALYLWLMERLAEVDRQCAGRPDKTKHIVCIMMFSTVAMHSRANAISPASDFSTRESINKLRS